LADYTDGLRTKYFMNHDSLCFSTYFTVSQVLGRTLPTVRTYPDWCWHRNPFNCTCYTFRLSNTHRKKICDI